MKTMKTGKTFDFGSQRFYRGSLKKAFKEFDVEDSVLIASQTSLRKAYNAHLFTLSDIPSKQIMWSLNKPFDDFAFDHAKIYIGLGGGTAIDIAKYFAKRNSARCIAIPSMLSTNVFATNKVAKVTETGKETVDGVLPKEVWYDDQLIALSKTENKYGLADALSIFTALADWRLASKMGKEKIDKSVYYKANYTLSKAIEYIYEDSIPATNIFEILCKSGEITNLYGSGRPESGSEHIIAKEIERLVKVPHGLAVCCGILIMIQIQEHTVDELKEITDSITNLHLVEEARKIITPEILTQALVNVKPRPDRYTYLDTCAPFDTAYISGLIKESHIYD